MNRLQVFAISALLYCAVLAIVAAWLDARIDRRVDERVARAVNAVVAVQRAEIERIRALVAAEQQRHRQASEEKAP